MLRSTTPWATWSSDLIRRHEHDNVKESARACSMRLNTGRTAGSAAVPMLQRSSLLRLAVRYFPLLLAVAVLLSLTHPTLRALCLSARPASKVLANRKPQITEGHSYIELSHRRYEPIYVRHGCIIWCMYLVCAYCTASYSHIGERLSK
ncbi:hypothetical protein HDK77DRAFT_14938 [Phyllosticta capitalensis]